jgi:hypothetical protein
MPIFSWRADPKNPNASYIAVSDHDARGQVLRRRERPREPMARVTVSKENRRHASIEVTCPAGAK